METKKCTKCGEEKELGEFPTGRTLAGTPTRHSQCRACKRCYDRARRMRLSARSKIGKPETKTCPDCGRHLPASRFYAGRASLDGLAGVCKECDLSRARKRRYGVDRVDIDLALVVQGGRCAICNTTAPGRAWDVDHDHLTGQVRGVLCHRCNTAIGLLSENPVLFAAAVVYLSGGRVVHAKPTQELGKVA